MTNSIAAQFDLQSRLYQNVLADISDEETNVQASEEVNHIKWLAGHICAMRLSLLPMFGQPKDESLQELFGHGNGLDKTKTYPPLSEIVDKWKAVCDGLSKGLHGLSSEALSAEAGQTPIGDSSMGGFLAFMMHHEAYHIGQIGILRKGAMSYA